MQPQQISVPLIIDGNDVFLSGEEHSFAPESVVINSKLKVIAQSADVASCHAAVDSCVRAFESWSQTSTTRRRRLFLQLAHLLRDRGEEIRCIMEEEIHATRVWSSINLEDSILMIEEAASLVTSPVLSGTLPPVQNPESQVLVFTEPLGVILGIAPWNSPLILGFRSVVAAIAAGNTAILKGSEHSPRTHYFIASLFRDAGFPRGVCNFLLHRETDAAQVFETIIERFEIRKCNFTGSTQVGRSISSKAGRALKPCLMELGGKNFVIVLEDADVDKAARIVAEGAFLNNGQICMSTDMVLVASQVYSTFRQALLSIVQNTTSIHVTQMITTKSAARIRDLISDAHQKGAIVHTALQDDDTVVNARGTHNTDIPATIIEDITPEMKLYAEESFGPLVAIMRFGSIDEAVGIIGECRYGLSAGIHSRDYYKALFLAKKLKIGAIHINGTTVHDESTIPHGGYGDSGWGRFGAGWGLSEFVQTKTIAINK